MLSKFTEPDPDTKMTNLKRHPALGSRYRHQLEAKFTRKDRRSLEGIGDITVEEQSTEVGAARKAGPETAKIFGDTGNLKLVHRAQAQPDEIKVRGVRDR